MRSCVSSTIQIPSSRPPIRHIRYLRLRGFALSPERKLAFPGPDDGRLVSAIENIFLQGVPSIRRNMRKRLQVPRRDASVNRRIQRTKRIRIPRVSGGKLGHHATIRQLRRSKPRSLVCSVKPLSEAVIRISSIHTNLTVHMLACRAVRTTCRTCSSGMGNSCP